MTPYILCLHVSLAMKCGVLASIHSKIFEFRMIKLFIIHFLSEKIYSQLNDLANKREGAYICSSGPELWNKVFSLI